MTRVFEICMLVMLTEDGSPERAPPSIEGGLGGGGPDGKEGG